MESSPLLTLVGQEKYTMRVYSSTLPVTGKVILVYYSLIGHKSLEVSVCHW